MKKVLGIGSLVVLTLIVVGGVVLYFSLNGIVRGVVETQGTKATGVATTLDGVNLNPFGGSLGLTDFALANPEGFSNPTIFRLGSADAAVQIGSLLRGEETVVDKVHVDGAEVVVAFENGKLNVQQLLKQINENAKPAEDEAEATEEDPAGESKGVVVRDLKITNTRVVGELALLPNTPPASVNFLIADIEETDFRGADTGAVIGYVIQTVMLNTTTGLAENVENLGQVVEDLGEIGTVAVGKAADEANRAIEGAGQAVDDVGKQLEEGLGGLLGGNRGNQKDEAAE
ncbi:MAG: hypothetical protein AAF800_12780 [Planctomycetota bacterium]